MGVHFVGETLHILSAAAHAGLRRWRFMLGWPAFFGLAVVVDLIVAKPTW